MAALGYEVSLIHRFHWRQYEYSAYSTYSFPTHGYLLTFEWSTVKYLMGGKWDIVLHTQQSFA